MATRQPYRKGIVTSVRVPISQYRKRTGTLAAALLLKSRPAYASVPIKHREKPAYNVAVCSRQS